jgi:RNA recognition motif-containing protein
MSEEEICETFSKAGKVTECRVLRWDSTFDVAALIRMGSVEEAIQAKELLNGKVHEKCLSKMYVALQQKAGETVPDHCFVKGLHGTTTEEQLQECFSKVGEVKWCKIFPLRFDPFSMKPPEVSGLVQMSSAEEAQAAVEKLNDTSPAECGAAICVRFAEVQSERADAKPNANLYVKGWPIGFPDFLMQSVFQQYGQVMRLRLLENPDPEQPTCAALVLMAREEDATNALKALDRQRISPPVPAMRVKYSGRDQAPSCNLYVTSLPRTISQDELRDTFKKYGEVVRLKLLNQDRSSELRALVELSSVEAAELAVRELDNTPPVFKGVTLQVMYASKREGKGEAA